MAYRLVFRRVAVREFEEAAVSYEEKAVELGRDFMLAVCETFDRIAENPFTYAVEHNGIRAATMSRFPHVIYYRIDRHTVVVLGVVHGARDPAIWKDRS
jgi:toxin ParE1/3/4